MLSTTVQVLSLGGCRWLLAKRFVYAAHVNVTGWHQQKVNAQGIPGMAYRT